MSLPRIEDVHDDVSLDRRILNQGDIKTMSRKVSSKYPPTTRLLLHAGVIIVTFIGLSWALGDRTAPTPSPQQAAAPHFVDTAQVDHHGVTEGRMVVVARLGETVSGISGETGPLMTTLVRGTYPEGATVATVRTDENCTPDQDGVSHCLNELDFGNTKIVVQHHHAMAKTPCLTPGEKVNVITVAQFEAQS